MRKYLYPVLGLSLAMYCSQSFGQEMPPTMVNTATVTTSAWQPKIDVTGKLVAHQGIVVKSEIAGRITNIKFHSGDFVHKGDPLIQINADFLLADKKLLETDLHLSKTEYTRKKDLYKKHAISKSDLDIATAHLKADEAKIEKIDIQLQQTQVKAPFTGHLGLRKVSLGDYVTPGQAIVNLQAINPVYVDFDVSETTLSKLKKSQTVALHSPSYPNEKFQGTIKAFESIINPGSQSLTVRAEIANKNGYLIPGSFVGVSLFLNAKKQVVMIPQTAIIYSVDGDFVFKTDGQTATKTKVVLGARTNDSVIIKDGLTAGDKIVTIGSMKLFNGAKIIDATAAASKKSADSKETKLELG